MSEHTTTALSQSVDHDKSTMDTMQDALAREKSEWVDAGNLCLDGVSQLANAVKVEADIEIKEMQQDMVDLKDAGVETLAGILQSGENALANMKHKVLADSIPREEK